MPFFEVKKRGPETYELLISIDWNRIYLDLNQQELKQLYNTAGEQLGE